MEKFSITNRYGLNIVGLLHIPENPMGLAFVMHGLGGFKEQEHMQLISNTFLNNNYIVVNFDATNSFNESEGNYENATMQKHYEDLVDVITWAKDQTWYQEQFVLAGHSLGGYAVARYAEDFPREVKAVFPWALVVSGELSFKKYKDLKPQELKTWQETGWKEEPSVSKPGLIKRLPYTHLEERLKHDLLPDVHNITMPTLFVVGENDISCPPEHNKILYDALPESTERESSILLKAHPTHFEPRNILPSLGIFWMHGLKK